MTSQRLHDSRGAAPIAVGARVFHQKFGYGTVGAVSDDRLHITFDKAGSKMVIAKRP